MSRARDRRAASRRWMGPVLWMIALAAFIVAVGCLPTIPEIRAQLAYADTTATPESTATAPATSTPAPTAKPKPLTYAQVRTLSSAQVRAIIRAEAKRAGYGKANTAALVTLAKRESTWHPLSKSKGAGCLGLFQLSARMCRNHRKAHPAWRWWRPIDNTRRAIHYIKGRYGSPIKALAHSYRYGWY